MKNYSELANLNNQSILKMMKRQILKMKTTQSIHSQVKKCLPFLLLCFMVLSVDAQVILYDQTGFISNESLTSQEFEPASSAFDNQLADDFVVPTGGWDLGGLDVLGTRTQVGPVQSFVDVFIYSDNGGSPGGLLISFDDLFPSADDGLGNFSVVFPSCVFLPAGIYWLSVVADEDFLTFGQWYWATQATQTGNPAYWQNPNDGFGTTCTSWSIVTTCIGNSDPDLAFRLHADILLDQSAGIAGNLVSQELEPANAAFDSEAADDFVVPPGGWNINSVTAFGVQFNGTGGAHTNVDVHFYNDQSGAPMNTPFLSFTDLVPSSQDNAGVFTIDFPSTVSLTSGTYWIAVVVDEDFVPWGQWAWSTITAITGSPFYWRNPGDGFASGCTAWTASTACAVITTPGDKAFILSASPCSSITPPQANAGPDASICPGQTVTIGGSPTATDGNAPYTYSWTPSGSLNSATVANPDASPTATTTYTVVVTDASGSTATDDVTVTVSSSVSVTGDVTDVSCNGLNDGAIDLTLPGGGGFTCPNPVIFSDLIQWNASSNGGTNPLPTNVSGDDFAELTNISDDPVDISGYQLERTGSGARIYTFPSGVVIPAQDILLVHFGTGTDITVPGPGEVLFFNSGGSNNSAFSSSQCGYILSDGSGTILDVGATNGFTVVGTGSPAATTNDWTGNVGSSSGRAGIFRTGSDSDNATDWTIASTANPTTAGTFNTGLDICAPQAPCQDVTITILTDNFPGETTWELREQVSGTVIASGGPYAIPANLEITTVCVDEGLDVTFEIFDSFGDGICCGFGTGSYTVEVGGNIVASGGQFASNEATNFTIPTSLPCLDVDISITLDNFPSETTWQLEETVSGTILASGGNYPGQAGQTVTATVCVTVGTDVTFTIFDSFGDGICCGFGTGSYSVTVDGNVVASGGQFGSSEATQFVIPNASTGGFTFIWSNGATDEDISGLSPGPYSVTIDDGQGCSGTGSFTVAEPTVITSSGTTSSYNGFGVSCFGGDDGSIDLTVTGGTPIPPTGCTDVIITILTDNFPGETTWSLIELPGGTILGQGGPYSIAGNLEVTTICVNAGQLVDFTIFDSFGDGICCGFGTGFYTVEAAGIVFASGGAFAISESTQFTVPGPEPYTYAWSNGQGIEDPVGLSAGIHTVTITDDNGCTATNSFTLTEPSVLTINITGISDFNGIQISCPGAADGFINTSISGGVSPYSFGWSHGPTTANLTGLSGGSYTITADDANGCTASLTITMVESDPLAVTDSTSNYNGQNISCNGGSDGKVYLSVTGGWSEPSVPNSLTTTFAGGNSFDGNMFDIVAINDILITGFDGNLDPGTGTVEIWHKTGTHVGFETSNAAWTLLGTTSVTSTGNGSATAIPIPLSVPIAAGQTHAFYVHNSNGVDYTNGATVGNVLVQDANLQVLEGSGGGYFAVTFSPRNFNGNVHYESAGSQGSLSFIWSDGQTTQDATGLSAGTYIVTVSDTNGCTATHSVTLTEPGLLVGSIAGVSNFNGFGVSCNGAHDGFVNISVIGGTTPYTYLWSDGAITQNINNLFAGLYTVTITDANNCTATVSWNVMEPPLFLVNVDAISNYNGFNVSCGGASDGSIQTSGLGGVPPYSYLWSNGQTTDDLFGLTAGLYSVTATDANNCSATATVVLTSPPLITVSLNGVDAACSGDSSGSATSVVLGGAAPYTYAWSNGATTANITNIPDGTYMLTVTDDNGCTASASIVIGSLAPITTALFSPTLNGGFNTLCAGDSTAFIDLTVTGGNPPFTYSWSNGTNSEDLANASAGVYSVTVTDVLGCSATDAITITGPTPVVATVTQTNVSCWGGSDGTLTITASGGTPPYTYNWVSTTITGLSAGFYTGIVTDANGCYDFQIVEILQPAALTTTIDSTDATCYQAANGSAMLNVSGGTPPFSYAWSHGPTTQNVFNLDVGVYMVTVTDFKGCVTTDTTTISEPSELQVSSLVTNVLCNGSSTGSVALTVIGGTPFYSFAWSHGSTVQNPFGMSAGTYTVTVTDDTGCVNIHSVTLTEPAALTATIAATNVSCNGGSDGAADLTVTGGVPPYFYIWTTGAVAEDIGNLSAGSYAVTVTDAHGCTVNSTVTITEPPLLLFTSSVTDATCPGGSDGAIDVTASGGTPPYTYSWGGGQTTEDLTGITAGNYMLSVMDANGCVASGTIVVTDPPDFLLTAVITDAGCVGGGTGSIDLTVQGGTGPYTYLWSNGSTMEDISGLAVGSYTVTVTDALNCTSSQTFQVLTITLSPNVTDVSCNGFSDGAIDLTPANGTPPYSFTWSTGATTEDISGLAAGIYSVSVSDNGGCSTTTTITVSEPPVLTASGTAQDATCFGDSDGSITLTVSGGVLPYVYSWSNGSTMQNLSNLAAGTYMVTVTDANGCNEIVTVVVSQPALLVPTATGTDISCFGGNDGTASVSVTGGTTPYIYQWNTGAVTQSISGLFQGFYDVTVTDANGCTAFSTITLNEPAAVLAIGVSITQPTCNGYTNGSIDITVTGGTTPYSYSWSNGSITQDLFNLLAGTYDVTVTDANGCTAMETIGVSEPAQITITAQINHVSCNGLSDGAITAIVTGGVPGLNYSWAHGPITPGITGLSAGTYYLTVSDFSGCVGVDSFTVTEPDVLTANIAGSDVSCNGGSNGMTDLTVSGGTAPYSYSWNNGAVTQDLFGVIAGTYMVTVTDAHGCTAMGSVTISEPLELVLFVQNTTHVSCNGGSNGAIDLAATGGTSPFSYSWSNGAVTQDISGLTAGLYTVQVIDGNGCISTLSVQVTEPTGLVASVTAVTNVTCNAGTDGALSISVGGGTPGYSYAWSNGSTMQNLSGIAAGTYTLTITDNNGCTTTTTGVVNEPAAVSISISITHVTCNGGSDGGVLATVTGGTPPYVYLWGTGSTSSGMTGLMAGSYSLTVTDANGCIETVGATVTEPTAITLTTTITDVDCNGNSTGAIDLSVSGGTPGYTYLWSNGMATEDISGLATGTFSVTVLDASGCSATTNVSVTEPDVLVATSVSTTTSACGGGSDGAIDLSVSGGTMPYSYNWSNGANSEDLSNVAANTYMVTVTDANGCQATHSETVTADAPIVVTATGNHVTCNGDADGSVNVSVTGGTGPYTYSWNTGSTNENLTNLSGGTYSVAVIDSRGCPAAASFTVIEPDVLTSSISVTNVSCNGGSDGALDLTVTGGTIPYSYLWSNGSTMQDISGLSIGHYFVTITDANGCSIIDNETISEPASLSVTTEVTDVTCNGANDGEIDLLISGGTSPYSYTWSNGSTMQMISGLTPGTYTVTVMDANGCSMVASGVVAEPAVLTATTTQVDVACAGLSNGQIDLTVAGGNPPYSYSWSNGSLVEDLFFIAAGSYSVTVTDALGCSATASATITEPSVISISGIVTDVSCGGNNDGAIDVSVSGGIPGYSYAWSNGANSQDLAGIAAGTYTLTVTDTTGCAMSMSFTVVNLSSLTITSTLTHVSCNGNSDGAIDITVTGGTGVYTYSWSNGSTMEDISGLTSGIYTVSVSDNGICSSTMSFTITQPGFLGLNIVATDADCFGASTGSVDLTVLVNGSVPGPYSYTWSNGAISEDLANLMAGVYNVTITDGNGCTYTGSASVGEPAEILITAAVVAVTCNGLSDGSIDISVQNAVAPATYSWSNGAVTEDLSGLAAGTYSVTVSGNDGCSNSMSITVSEPDALVPIISGSQGPSCPGEADGSVNMTINGGTTPFTFAWSNGSTMEDLFFAAAGFYQLTVNDANGCSAVHSITLFDPPALAITTVSTDATVFGGSDGTIDATVSGGTPPYSYAWSHGATTEDVTGLIAGVYTVTVTDSRGCTITANDVVRHPCDAVTTVFTSNITPTSAVLNWVAVNGAHHYVIRGRKIGNPFWVYISVPGGATDSKAVYGLAPNKTFEWQVIVACNANNTFVSEWSSLDTFSTVCVTPEPTWTSNVTSYTATFNWTDVAGEIGYEIRARKTGGPWFTIFMGQNITQKTVFTLQPAMQYEWMVRAICDTGANSKSEFTPLLTFTTDPLFPRFGQPETVNAERGNSSLGIYPNPSEGRFEMVFKNSSTHEETISMQIYNMKGQEIWNADFLTSDAGELKQEFDMTRFGKGVYFIRISGEKDTHHQRIVIQ